MPPVDSKFISIVDTLRGYDLRTVDIEEVKSTLRKIGNLPAFGLEVPVGSIVHRTRTEIEDIPISYTGDIAIKKPEWVKNYGRCNSPGYPLFYGGIPSVTVDHCHKLCMFEATKIIGKNAPYLIEYATTGKWVVTESFKGVAIIQSKNFHNVNPEFKRMHENYLKFLQTFPDPQNYLYITEYLAEEFEKEVNEGEEYKYKITAAFSEIVLDTYQAIIYPSVKDKDEGRGFNLALPKSIYERHLNISQAITNKIYKNPENNKVYFIDAHRHSGKPDGDKFNWTTIEPQPLEIITAQLNRELK